jgi:mannose-1-phosphate guanylyltransferase
MAAALLGHWHTPERRMDVGPRRLDQWAIVLAGGEGERLRPLTRCIAGDERPKQFCPLLDGVSMLEQTRARVARVVRPDRTCLVLTRSHECFYSPLLAHEPGLVAVQPFSRGTAPAVLLGALRVAEQGPRDAVALFPSDHYVSDDSRFMAHVEGAFAAVEARPELVILLGIEADGPEVQYGWIEAADRIPVQSAYPVYRIRRFWEKPTLAIAETLFEQGCLWNAFVLVARVPALIALIRDATPGLYGAFITAWHRRATLGEGEALRSLYTWLPSTNFSEGVLATDRVNLAVLPVHGVTWSDWGDPARVLRTLEGLGIHPEWATGEMMAGSAR